MRMHGGKANAARDVVGSLEEPRVRPPVRPSIGPLVEAARTGRGGGALLVSGAAGLGVSTLLADAAGAFGERVLYARGVAVEASLPYGGLHALTQRARWLRARPPRRRPTREPHQESGQEPGRESGRRSPQRPVPQPAPRSVRQPAPQPPARQPARELALTGFLALLTELAEDGPLLVCVDDAHQVDPASREALGFAARRLGEHLPVVLLLGLRRERADDPCFAGIPTYPLRPWGPTAAGALLDELVPGAHPAVREALLGAGRGNPGLLTDLAGNLTDQQCAGTVPLPRPLSADGDRLRAATARVRALPEDTRTLLLLAAAVPELADPVDPANGPAGPDTADLAVADTVFRAASRAGIGPERLERAVRERVLSREGDVLRFADPLLRRAAYWGEPPARRRTAHRLLAWALEGRERLPALWHRAMASERPDPALAHTLATTAERSVPVAAHAQVPRASALLVSAALADDPEARAAHLTSAAQGCWAAGRPHRARTLLDEARQLPASDLVRGHAERLRGELELRNGVVTDAREVLLYAAELLAPHDPGAARGALLAAADASWATADLAGYRAVLDRAAELPDAAAPGKVPGPELLAAYREGMAAVARGRSAESAAPLRRVLELAARERDPERLTRASGAALVLGELGAARELSTRAVAAARSRGATVLLPQALEYQVYGELRSGRHTRAGAYAREGLELALRTGQRNCAAHHHAALAMVAAVEGDTAECAARARAACDDAGPHGLGVAGTLAQWALARSDLTGGRPRAALARLGPLVCAGPVARARGRSVTADWLPGDGHPRAGAAAPGTAAEPGTVVGEGGVERTPGTGPGHFALRWLAVPCFVEAAVLAGTPELATGALVEFEGWTEATADPQAPAQLARCRALLCDEPDAAGALFARAMTQHVGVEGEFERGRTQLLHGMALRRRRRPSAAREVLRDALVTFDRCGARAWGDWARSELRATGESTGGPPGGGAEAGALDELTPQQLRIARHVAEGATNREVATRLSVSPRTVDHHLRNVFAVLGIRSRVELTRFLSAPRHGEPAARP